MKGLRVLLVGAAAEAVKSDALALEQAGAQVETAREPSLAVAAARARQFSLVIADAVMPVLSGREMIRALRAFPETAGLPVILVADRCGPADELRALLGGAVALWPTPLEPRRFAEAPALLAEWAGQRQLAEPERRFAALLGRLRARRVSGALLANAGTPFEGRIEVLEGNVSRATFGGLAARAAITELLALKDVTWRFDERGAAATPLGSDEGQAAWQPHLLLVDDEEDLRRLWTLRLARAGFRVDTAEHGQQGLDLCAARQYDLVIADLSMPVLDGWGMLAALRADPRMAEVPVLVLSAHDDLREGLKAARAGAHDYLTKTGHAEAFLEKVRALTRPRSALMAALDRGVPALGVELAAVGPMWLLRALGRAEATAVVDARDELGSYVLHCAAGHLLDAKATYSGRVLHDEAAVLAFGAARSGLANVQPWALGDSRDGAPLENVVDKVGLKLADAEKRLLAAKVGTAVGFGFAPELYALFLGVGSETDVRILQALHDEGLSPGELPARLELPVNVVRRRLTELVRRGVLVVPESSPAGAEPD